MSFTTDEEIQEYLTNLGIEYRFGCFSEKKPEVCHLLGEYLESITQEYKKAAKVFRNNCDDGNFPKSCTQYGTYLMLGKGLRDKDVKKAFHYFKKGCDYDERRSCYNKALYNLGHMDQCRDFINAKHDFNNKNVKAEDGISKNMTKAAEVSKKGCDLGDMQCCGNLSQMYARGDGVEQNAKLAAKYRNMAIEIHDNINKTKQTIEFQQGI